MNSDRSRAAAVALGLLALCAGAAVAQQPAAAPDAIRIEHDLLGEKAVPANAYYGVQTARALENFRISGTTVGDYPAFVRGWALTKMAAAMANADVGKMDAGTRDAGCEENDSASSRRPFPWPAARRTRAAPAPAGLLMPNRRWVVRLENL